jgi:hypothetical protein
VAPQKGVLRERSRGRKRQGRFMAVTPSEPYPAPANGRVREPGLLADISAFWHQFCARAFDPYRPELHYMRGPGPAWHAKHLTLSTSVQSRIVEIRTRKRRR